MKFKVLLAIGAFILLKTISVPAAGGWTSGGGELIRDQHNPWFIQNTKQVNYCIQIDEKEFGQDRQFVSKQVTRTIRFWQAQLKELQYISYSISWLVVGTQIFAEVDCKDNHDITFQFGVLNTEQAKRLGDISKTIAVSVRTDYDLKKLKSQGFIYFAKDNHFSGKPWSSDAGVRLLPVLVHELGHVFGVQHREDVEFMSENYPESVLSSVGSDVTLFYLKWLNESGLAKKHLFTYAGSEGSMKHVFGCLGGITLPKPKMTVNSDSVTDKFFNKGKDDNCQTFYINKNRFEYASGKGQVSVVGAADLTRQDPNDLWNRMNATNVINFWLPKEQTVFPNMEEQFILRKLNIASFVPAVYFKGDYRTLDGKIKRPIVVEILNNGSIKRVSGVMDGILYNNLPSGF